MHRKAEAESAALKLEMTAKVTEVKAVKDRGTAAETTLGTDWTDRSL